MGDKVTGTPFLPGGVETHPHEDSKGSKAEDKIMVRQNHAAVDQRSVRRSEAGYRDRVAPARDPLLGWEIFFYSG